VFRYVEPNGGAIFRERQALVKTAAWRARGIGDGFSVDSLV
jgi:hypothetical protein